MAVEKNTKLYKKVSGWIIGKEIEKDKNSNRQIAKLVLGEIRVGRNIEQYITEDIYYDVVQNVYSNPQDYDVTVKINMVPQVTILLDGQLIPHNPDILLYTDKITSVLNDIQKDIILDGYNEMRLNINSKSKLEDATELLSAMIRKKTGIHFAVPFIRAVIAQWIEDTFFSTTPNVWSEDLRNFEYTELVTLCNEIIKVKCGINVENEIINSYLKSTKKDSQKALKELENFIGTELILRLIKGTIKNR